MLNIVLLHSVEIYRRHTVNLEKKRMKIQLIIMHPLKKCSARPLDFFLLCCVTLIIMVLICNKTIFYFLVSTSVLPRGELVHIGTVHDEARCVRVWICTAATQIPVISDPNTSTLISNHQFIRGFCPSVMK